MTNDPDAPSDIDIEELLRYDEQALNELLADDGQQALNDLLAAVEGIPPVKPCPGRPNRPCGRDTMAGLDYCRAHIGLQLEASRAATAAFLAEAVPQALAILAEQAKTGKTDRIRERAARELLRYADQVTAPRPEPKREPLSKLFRKALEDRQ